MRIFGTRSHRLTINCDYGVGERLVAILRDLYAEFSELVTAADSRLVAGSARAARVRAVIVDAGRGTRHLDNTRSEPSSLSSPDRERTVLDWMLHALGRCDIRDVTYVGGYHIEKVIDAYPNLAYRFNANWSRQGELAGIQLVDVDPKVDCLIIRASTICLPEAVRLLVDSGGAVAFGRYGRQTADLAGLMVVPSALVPTAFAIAQRLNERDKGANLDDWLAALEAEGVAVRPVDLDGLAAPMRDTVAVVRTVFGGKGRTLDQIAPLIRSARVLDRVRFAVRDWLADQHAIIERIQHTFGDGAIVVRSSAHAEDDIEESAAGRFSTVLDVPSDRPDLIQQAVSTVIASYATGGRSAHPLDEVLVQPQVGDLAASGVLLTRDLETGAPYYVINIDRHSGRSNTVTSGTDDGSDTLYVSRRSTPDLGDDVHACIALARELEKLTRLDALDIEFGIDRAGTVYLFQVRPMTRVGHEFSLADDDLGEELEQVGHFLDARLGAHPLLAGSRTIFGTMPDWNPAEMIGTTPRPLALSLYQRLIGDRSWAVARTLIGYRDVFPEPLIVSLGGRPYVDVRASLNSLLPAALERATSERWVDHCLRLLDENPDFHDKLEFDVTVTCMTLDVERIDQRLASAGLGPAESEIFRSLLLGLTDRILRGLVAPIDDQFARLDELTARRRARVAIAVTGVPGLARRIHLLLADCEQYGVVPFAILARYAFIALDFLRSLEQVGVMAPAERESLLRSLPTVATELSRDVALHAAGRLSTDEFLERYGHLRPSSYDITSPNYGKGWRHYLGNELRRSEIETPAADPTAARAPFDQHADELARLLGSADFTATVGDLRSFVLRSIPGREKAKFEFMKSVDVILECVAQLGEELGFDREDMSFLPIDIVARAALDSPTAAIRTEFRRHIEFNKKRWNLTCAMRLPHLVHSRAQIEAFALERWTPNFISSKRVVAPPLLIDEHMPDALPNGRIVLIRAADPGYDWLFTHPIAGLVTEYGGAASHMAIRAAEFGLPAAIGCGSVIFDGLIDARLVELDCMNGKVRPLT